MRAPSLTPSLRVALFCRGFGFVVLAFAQWTLPTHIETLRRSVLAFPFSPISLGPLPESQLELLRSALTGAGASLAAGVLPRTSLAVSAALVGYFAMLDRSLYQNHHVFLVELALLLFCLDRRVLEWPHRREAPGLPAWQLRALQLLSVSPYAFGALAKLNPTWLLEAQPVRSWADGLLGDLDDAMGGALGRAVDAALPAGADITVPFAYAVCYAGLLLDLLVPIALLRGGTAVRACATAAAACFHLTNRLLFGLGVFPPLMAP